MDSKTLKSEIQVQQYEPGKPFPGLFYEIPAGTVKGGFSCTIAIVLIGRNYGVVLPGETLQISKDFWGQVSCVGRVPEGFK